jgi:hypothetical protein
MHTVFRNRDDVDATGAADDQFRVIGDGFVKGCPRDVSDSSRGELHELKVGYLLC